jgi:hypothetical protein
VNLTGMSMTPRGCKKSLYMYCLANLTGMYEDTRLSKVLLLFSQFDGYVLCIMPWDCQKSTDVLFFNSNCVSLQDAVFYAVLWNVQKWAAFPSSFLICFNFKPVLLQSQHRWFTFNVILSLVSVFQVCIISTFNVTDGASSISSRLVSVASAGWSTCADCLVW